MHHLQGPHTPKQYIKTVKIETISYSSKLAGPCASNTWELRMTFLKRLQCPRERHPKLVVLCDDCCDLGPKHDGTDFKVTTGSTERCKKATQGNTDCCLLPCV